MSPSIRGRRAAFWFPVQASQMTGCSVCVSWYCEISDHLIYSDHVCELRRANWWLIRKCYYLFLDKNTSEFFLKSLMIVGTLWPGCVDQWWSWQCSSVCSDSTFWTLHANQYIDWILQFFLIFCWIWSKFIQIQSIPVKIFIKFQSKKCRQSQNFVNFGPTESTEIERANPHSE